MSKDTPLFLIDGVSTCWKHTLLERFRFILSMKGMTFTDLADEVEINKGTLSKIANGQWYPTAKVKILIGKALGCDSLILFGDDQYYLDYKKTFEVIERENGNGEG